MSPDWSAKEDPVPYARMDEPQTLNLYGYLTNNPLGGVDADGHQWSWDKTKTVLDVVGFVPVVGDFANLGSAGISLAQGHYAEAAVSALAAIPVVGVVGEIGKGAELVKDAKLLVSAEKEVGAAVRAGEEGGEIAKAVHGNSLTTDKLTTQYRLEDRNTGDVLKYGETTKPGGKGRYSQPQLDSMNADLVPEATGSKADMKKLQTEKIKGYEQENGQKPPLNKTYQ